MVESHHGLNTLAFVSLLGKRGRERREGDRMRETERAGDRQTDKQTDRQTDTLADPTELDAGGLNVGIIAATLPDTWHLEVSAGTGWPGVSLLCLRKVITLICNVCLRVAARATVRISVPELHCSY